MEILEFGDKEKDKIILIHGFETPYQIWEKYIEHYKKDYHIIVPILQGHNPNMKEDFNSFEESAKDIEDYVISRYGNNVFAIYGMSMGGVLTSQIWQNKKLYIDKVILESSPLISYNRLMTLMMTKQYLMLTHKTQARDKRVITQAVNSIIPKDKLDVFLAMMDNMSDASRRPSPPRGDRVYAEYHQRQRLPRTQRCCDLQGLGRLHRRGQPALPCSGRDEHRAGHQLHHPLPGRHQARHVGALPG